MLLLSLRARLKRPASIVRGTRHSELHPAVKIAANDGEATPSIYVKGETT